MFLALKTWLAAWRAPPAGASGPTRSDDRTAVRRHPRMRDGYISWPARPAHQPQLCRVVDMSVNGACVAIDGIAPTAEAWTRGARLYIAGDAHEWHCGLAWQKGVKFGLRFEGRPQALSRVYR